MPSPPRQSRSIESTRRMLDAAEDLLREGGSDALTVEAVIERAGTSTGAFYARFGSRNGLLVAMHERFLDYFGAPLVEAATEALERDTLHAALHTFVGGVVSSVRRHRNTLLFHVVQNAHQTGMRNQGNELTQALARLVEQIIESHQTELVAVDPNRANPNRADTVARVLHSFTLQLMLFDDDEVTGRTMSADQMVDQLTEMFVSFLTQT